MISLGVSRSQNEAGMDEDVLTAGDERVQLEDLSMI